MWRGSGPSTDLFPSHLVQVSSLKLMYLFAGGSRHSDVASFLKKWSTDYGFSLQLKELDIGRSPEHDLKNQALWDDIFNTLAEGEWCLIVSPPCNTFSRARYQFAKHPGPRPLRSKTYPKGFPWLSNKDAAIVSESNMFVSNCIKACRVCHNNKGHFLGEHPEDLGQVQGDHPGSIWQWEEVQALIADCSAITFAIQQCHFTRFITDLKVDDPRCYISWPRFDDAGNYVGPLPRSCGHVHSKKLIGKKDGKWNTSPSAAYPPSLCEFIAKLFVSAEAASGGGRTHSNNSFREISSGPSGAVDTLVVSSGEELEELPTEVEVFPTPRYQLNWSLNNNPRRPSMWRLVAMLANQ